MTNPVTTRQNTLDQWRLNLNTIGNNVGDPSSIYASDGSDSFVLPAQNMLVAAINDLNSRKMKRSGDTIANLAITTTLSVGSTASIAGAVSLTNATDTSSPSTGALVVTGGVGIGKSLYLGGSIFLPNNADIVFKDTGGINRLAFGLWSDNTLNIMNAGGVSTRILNQAANAVLFSVDNTGNAIHANGVTIQAGGLSVTGNGAFSAQVSATTLNISGTSTLAAVNATAVSASTSLTSPSLTVTTVTLNANGKVINNNGDYFSYGISMSSMGNIGQFEFPYGTGGTFYNAGWRNDGSNLYLLLSNGQASLAAARSATWNGLRPIVISTATGAITIDSTGAGVTIGGQTIHQGLIQATAGLTGSAIGTATGSLGSIWVYNQNASVNGGGAFMAFHRGGVYAAYFGLDTDNVLKFGGWSAGANAWPVMLSNGGTYNVNITGNAATATSASSIAFGVYTNVANTLTQKLTVSGTGTASMDVSGDITAGRTATTGAIYLGSNQAHYLYFDGANYSLGGTSQLLINGQITHTNGNFMNNAAFTPALNAWTLNNTNVPMHISYSGWIAAANAWNYHQLWINTSPTMTGARMVASGQAYWAYGAYVSGPGQCNGIVPAGWYYYIATAASLTYTGQY